MKRIHYAEDVIVTGDDIADAVMGYARALAVSGGAETVDLPALVNGQSVGRVQVLIGPASQIFVSEEHGGATEIIDEPLVAALRERTGHLHGPAPVFTDDDVSVPTSSIEIVGPDDGRA